MQVWSFNFGTAHKTGCDDRLQCLHTACCVPVRLLKACGGPLTTPQLSLSRADDGAPPGVSCEPPGPVPGLSSRGALCEPRVGRHRRSGTSR
jgi:hypothetical protein